MRRRWMLLWIVAVAAAGCTVNPATGKRLFIPITTAQEVAIGENAAPDFEKEFDGRVDDAALQDYVAQVGAKMAAVQEREGISYEYHLLRSDIPNAFALPGGKVYVTAGLMKLMTNERQLAAVLGHETGHVAAQHNVQGLVENVGASVLIELAGYAAGEPNAAKAEAVAKVIAGVTTLKYSRNKEYEADLLGVRYMTKAGYNPYGMVELLQALLEASGGEEGGRLGEMLATHPLTGSRIEKAEGVIKQDHPAADRNAADPAADRFKQMKRRL